VVDFIQEKIEIIKKKLNDSGLYDVRLVVLVVVGLIALSVFWNGAKIIQRNYELTQKVAEIEKENEVLELENRNKELQNQYLATDEFAELTARRVFGKASPGERVYIVPEEVAIASLDQSNTEEDLENSNKNQRRSNFEAWMDIYFGR
jgi:cell division protein FtsB